MERTTKAPKVRYNDVYAHIKIRRPLYDVASAVAQERGIKYHTFFSDVFEAGLRVKRLETKTEAAA